MTDDKSYEHNKWEYELKKSAAERAHDNETEFGHKNNDAAINAANAAIRIALLINGGAAVSVLAFIGGLVAQKVVPVSELGKIAAGLMWFTSGVALAGLSAGLAYFTNYCIATRSAKKLRMWEHPYLKDTRTSTTFWWLALICELSAVLCVLLSLTSFVVGTIRMHQAIVGLPTAFLSGADLLRQNKKRPALSSRPVATGKIYQFSDPNITGTIG
jgi:hypothetical protein